MTLVELLVVISILGLLAVAVIPNFANTGDRRKVREAARAISSFMAGGQSRALGSRAGGGVWFDPLSSTISSGPLSIGAAIDLAEADVAQPYGGNFTSSTITALTSSTGTQAAATFSEACGPLVSNTNLIRLGGYRTAYVLRTVTGTTFTTATIEMQSSGTTSTNLNQTIYNASWPKVPSAGITYEIYGPPSRSSASTLTLGNGVAIDLYHSWVQGQTLQTVLRSGTTPFQILFDATGKPYCLASNGGRQPMNTTLFLLVAPIESIQSSGTASDNSLAPTDGYWVAIDPRGGIPKVAEVYASGTTLFQQQKYIREGAVQLGR